MKIACSSSSFAGPIAAGEITQLEWLERSASAAGVDGVVFDIAQFPRTDDEYVAQLKKVAIDLGLVPVALDAPALLDPLTDEAGRDRLIGLAGRLGTLFVLTRLPAPGPVPPAAFVAAVAAAKSAVKAAKRVNVTLLAAPGPETLAADLAELRHFLKDVDSAWLRYAVPAAVDRSIFNARDRALVSILAADVLPADVADVDDEGRPWLVLSGDASVARVRALRVAAAKKTLALASVS
ncbi:MAG: hypothetical protein NVSMB5_02470 [Candidatus Velthaea sp.]